MASISRLFPSLSLAAVLTSVAGHAAAGGDGPSAYRVHNLVSDGTVPADHVDTALVNAWGLTAAPTSPWWVADNGTGVSTLYDGTGVARSLVVTVPTPVGGTPPASPTGAIFNGAPGFVVTDGVHSGASVFIFATEQGVIAGWSPAVPPPPPSTNAMIAVDSSAEGAIYKGLAEGHSVSRGDLLYATDFHNGRVDIFDSGFAPVVIPGAFEDPGVPDGFAPFGIANLGGKIFVTFALQDQDAEDELHGAGLGFVSVFDADGNLLYRLHHNGLMNAPWGVAMAPADFGRFSGKVLVGNFGSGRINAYEPATGRFLGSMRNQHGRPIEIDGLWGLGFGNGAASGPTTTLYFTAGPDDEHHGLFGLIEAARGDDHHDGDDGDDDRDD